MKKIFLLGLCLILVGCAGQGYEKENPKNQINQSKALNEQVFSFLDGKNLKDSFSNPHAYSSLNFYDKGDFDGDFLSNSDLDGLDFGLREESQKIYNRSEIHKSIFSGKFKIVDTIEKGIYKLKLSDFTINNQKGPDAEIKYQSWVDFANGLREDDEYILYLKGAPLDTYLLENNQYEEIIEEDHEEEGHHDHSHEDHDEEDDHDHENDEGFKAYGIILYNKTQGIIFTEHDKWAFSNHHHHD
ncbi:hypothetical protein [uncultured Anaerococcus sp.]|uniref:hypothetical protein n=1 Tax=uncultured Anaerococcus sp. TaxID=293428 RepID=UPI0025CE8ED7|nr:hypothetical protein [uncultured Anaerococcus sp.]